MIKYSVVLFLALIYIASNFNQHKLIRTELSFKSNTRQYVLNLLIVHSIVSGIIITITPLLYFIIIDEVTDSTVSLYLWIILINFAVHYVIDYSLLIAGTMKDSMNKFISTVQVLVTWIVIALVFK